MVALIHLLHGCVQFHTQGKNPEKLFNRIIAAGLPIWEIKTENNTVVACTTPDGYRSKLQAQPVRRSFYILYIRRGVPWKLILHR